jgi:hypothetical protein
MPHGHDPGATFEGRSALSIPNQTSSAGGRNTVFMGAFFSTAPMFTQTLHEMY